MHTEGHDISGPWREHCTFAETSASELAEELMKLRFAITGIAVLCAGLLNAQTGERVLAFRYADQPQLWQEINNGSAIAPKGSASTRR